MIRLVSLIVHVDTGYVRTMNQREKKRVKV